MATSLRKKADATAVNNLAASFAQHPLVPLQSAPGDGQEPAAARSSTPTRAELLANARRWASAAFKHATDTKGEARTSECDEACAVALGNLGDISSLSGDAGEARRYFEQSQELSRRIGFAPGLNHAETGLKKLDGGSP
jgi:hypothetical protein